jgi:UDP-N-acetylmuramoyl-L-alanyl-D-glutamate--2,6-diaminopimelate ligase
MDEYAAAKAMLFASLNPESIAAVNGEDPWTERMLQDCRAKVIRFGFGSGMDYAARDVMVNSRGSHFVLVTPDGQANISMNLIGRHNIENALAASALLGETFGLTVHQLAAGLSRVTGAPGRLEAVTAGQPFSVLVDYAHSDDALENVLSALRPLVRGASLRVVFGCGGDRDRSKRPRMAETACRIADAIYVTSDNPRTEDAEAIIREILCGVPLGAGPRVRVEPDRHKAIRMALADAGPGDIVLLAGKGHENYQIVGTTKNHFDDREEAIGCLKKYGKLVSA